MVIKTLIIEEDRPSHIAKHDIALEEVEQILVGDYVYIKSREDRWLLIGKTKKKRFLTIVIGERKEKGVYGLVTARPSRKDEKSFFLEYIHTHGGEENNEN